MSGIIEAFHRIQDIERELASIRRDEESKERRIEQHKRQLAQVDRKLRDLLEQTRDAQREIDGIDLDFRAREETIAKHREALSHARTTKEYAAILTTINTEKADANKIENAALQRMGQLDELKANVSDVEQEKQVLLERLVKSETALADYRTKTMDQRQRLQAMKEAASEAVPATSLQTFDRVARHHDGEAMAEVTRIHPRREEYCCSGCNMKVSLEVVNTLHLDRDLQFCQLCGRILYLSHS